MSIDTNTLRKAIRDFQFHSTPSNGDHNAPCTVGDIHKLVNGITKLLNTFVAEIENTK